MERKLVLTGVIRCKDEYLVVRRSKDDDSYQEFMNFLEVT